MSVEEAIAALFRISEEITVIQSEGYKYGTPLHAADLLTGELMDALSALYRARIELENG